MQQIFFDMLSGPDRWGQSKITIVPATCNAPCDFTLTPEFSHLRIRSRRDGDGLHLGLLVIFQADLFYKFKLGFQPVHVLLLIFEDIFQDFAADIIPLVLATGYGLP